MRRRLPPTRSSNARAPGPGSSPPRGFRDVLIIGRQKRYDTYDMYIDKPLPLVARRHIAEVRGARGARRRSGGAARIRLHESRDRRDGRAGRESVAVCLLHAYANPEHEQASASDLAARARSAGLALLGCLAQVPRVRAHQHHGDQRLRQAARRAATCAVWSSALADARLRGRPVRHAVQRRPDVRRTSPRDIPVRIIESGPAAGIADVRGVVGKEEGLDRRHHLRHGRHHRQARRRSTMASRPSRRLRGRPRPLQARAAACPINVPAVDMIEIGAGGGSIARDRHGA